MRYHGGWFWNHLDIAIAVWILFWLAAAWLWS